jgi:outer membrane murein-binding lipoprotein Lpp
MWLTVPFAQETKRSDYKKTIESQNTLIEGLTKKQHDLESQRNSALEAKTAGEACHAAADALKQYLSTSATTVQTLQTSLDQVQKWVEAARSNSSDAATCSLRASQGLVELAKSTALVSSISSNLSSAASLAVK